MVFNVTLLCNLIIYDGKLINYTYFAALRLLPKPRCGGILVATLISLRIKAL